MEALKVLLGLVCLMPIFVSTVVVIELVFPSRYEGRPLEYDPPRSDEKQFNEHAASLAFWADAGYYIDYRGKRVDF